ncbi:UNVERIFIED_CONTAM: hypothetical protein Scaly_2516500 [Sesamum calycinum]|uniref:MULE transposase domain-containing protein n=1 Tax=Sesamum calycinum TaxID=2727403 RepID=A0AAW2LT42_9LAMI
MSLGWLSKKYLHKFKTDPEKGVKVFRVDAIEDKRCDISRFQASRAKKLALLMIEGSPNEQYKLLWDYAEEIKRSNLGSIVILGTKISLTDFMCPYALKMTIICVDRCHLKGPHGGVLLFAIEIDPNNNFFPICYAVVMRENRETWDWFLTLMKKDLMIQDDSTWSFMPDKQKGLVGALQELFPNAEHRFCVRHLHSNFKTFGFRGLAFKNGLWKAARATTINQFNQRMQELKDLDEGFFAWFSDKPPKE